MRKCIKLIEFSLKFYFISDFFDNENILLLTFESGGDRDADSCFYFISGEHPDLDSCISHIFKWSGNIILEFILNTSDSKKFHILFHKRDNLSNTFISIFKLFISFCEFFNPVIIEFFFNKFLCNNKCSESFSG